MTPELAKKLSEIPEVKELIAYLAEKALELNNLADIKLDTNETATEVKARQRAFEKITEILEPLINLQTDKPSGFSRKEYQVD